MSDPKLGTALLNKRTLERLDYLLNQGYRLKAVNGYTSPEGRRRPPEPTDRGAAARWEGNIRLSERRAEKVLSLIKTRYALLAKKNPVLLMRHPRGLPLPNAVGMSEYPMLDKRAGVELEDSALDRLLILGNREVKPFLDQHPDELARMTEDDRKFITDQRQSTRLRAERLFQNLRRVEIHLTHYEKLRSVDRPDITFVHEHDCPADVIEAAERKWGSRIPFTKPDPPRCG